jgi:hypothetical protein
VQKSCQQAGEARVCLCRHTEKGTKDAELRKDADIGAEQCALMALA